MGNGWIKLHRDTLSNPVIMKDAEHFAVWNYLLLNAAHTEHDIMFNGSRMTIKCGQLITGRKSISDKLKINESKTQRILKLFENEHLIEQQTCNKNRLISILSWEQEQQDEQQDEQQLNNKRTTTEQQVNTNKKEKNVKKEKNDKNKNILLDSAVQSMRKKFGGMKDAAAARKKLPTLIDKYGVDVLDRCVTRYMSEVERRRESGFTELRCVNEGTFWNGRYESYLDENYDYQDVVAELNDKWLNKDGSKPDWLAE